MVEKQTAGKSYRNTKPPGHKPIDESETKELVTTNGGNGHALVATNGDLSYLDEYENTGEGLSTDVRDNLIPRIKLLQSGSPECIRSEAAYIPGAEGGQVYIRGLEVPLIECRSGQIGSEKYQGPGLLVQAIALTTDIVEFIPKVGGRGGGFVDTHPVRSDETEEQAMIRLGGIAQPKKSPRAPTPYKLKNGNELIPTRNYLLLLHLEAKDADGNYVRTGVRMPLRVGFKGTEHTFAREWMTKKNQVITPKGKKANMWMALWRLTTGPDKNELGSWFGWRSNREGWATGEEIELAKALRQAFMSGDISIKDTKEDHTEGGGSATYASSNVSPDDMDVVM